MSLINTEVKASSKKYGESVLKTIGATLSSGAYSLTLGSLFWRLNIDFINAFLADISQEDFAEDNSEITMILSAFLSANLCYSLYRTAINNLSKAWGLESDSAPSDEKSCASTVKTKVNNGAEVLGSISKTIGQMPKLSGYLPNSANMVLTGFALEANFHSSLAFLDAKIKSAQNPQTSQKIERSPQKTAWIKRLIKVNNGLTMLTNLFAYIPSCYSLLQNLLNTKNTAILIPVVALIAVLTVPANLRSGKNLLYKYHGIKASEKDPSWWRKASALTLSALRASSAFDAMQLINNYCAKNKIPFWTVDLLALFLMINNTYVSYTSIASKGIAKKKKHDELPLETKDKPPTNHTDKEILDDPEIVTIHLAPPEVGGALLPHAHLSEPVSQYGEGVEMSDLKDHERKPTLAAESTGDDKIKFNSNFFKYNSNFQLVFKMPVELKPNLEKNLINSELQKRPKILSNL
jgi:hypothetical protein